MYTESDFAIELLGILLLVAWCYTVGGWVWRMLPGKWERNEGNFLIMFFVFLPASTFFVMAIIYTLNVVLVSFNLYNQVLLGILTTIICSFVMWWANEQNEASKNSAENSRANESTSKKFLEESQVTPSHEPVMPGTPVSNLRATNFKSTISSIAAVLKVPFAVELALNKNTLPTCLLEDDYILGFCWALSIRQAKQENLEPFKLSTEVKYEILIQSICEAFSADVNVLRPIIKNAVNTKTNLFCSGSSDGEEYEWNESYQIEEKLEARKAVLVKSRHQFSKSPI